MIGSIPIVYAKIIKHSNRVLFSCLKVGDFMEDKYLLWDFHDDCPCGCPNEALDYDFVEEDDGSYHDVVDCPKCGKRLYYETEDG